VAVPRVGSTKELPPDSQFRHINTTSPLKRSNSVPVGNHAPVDPRTITQANLEREDHTLQSIAATLTNLAMQQLIEGLNKKGVLSIDLRVLDQFYKEIARGALNEARQQITASST